MFRNRKRRGLVLGFSAIDMLHWRMRDPGTEGALGGNATPAAQNPEPDTPPVNGGPDRDFESLSGGTVEDPDAGQAGNPPAQQRQAPPTPADPNQRAGTTLPAQQQPVAAQWQSIREAAAAQGFNFDPTIQDDRAALNFLLAQAQRGRDENVYAQLGRQLAPRAQEIQGFLRQQQQPQQPAARQPWEAPEFDERWAALVDQHPTTGMFIGKPGTPHDIVQKVNDFVEWKKNYDRNPAAVINGMVEARAKAISTETFREQFATQQREATIQTIVRENSPWMYQTGPGGERLRDYQGNFVPTQTGAMYLGQVQLLQQAGIRDPSAIDQLAKQLVRGQLSLAAQQQAASQQLQATNPGTQQAVNQPNRNPGQALPPSSRRVNPAATEPDQTGLTLAEMLRQSLAADGVTDADIRREFE